MRNEKQQLVRDISAELGDSHYVVLVHYKGLKVEEFNSLREDLSQVGATCRVVPNRLFTKAAAEGGWDPLATQALEGDTAMIVGGEDVVEVAKKIDAFNNVHEPLQVKFGAIKGRVLASADVEKLAKLPSREVLLAQLLGVLQAPARNLASVLQQKTGSIVYALQAYLEKRQNAE